MKNIGYKYSGSVEHPIVELYLKDSPKDTLVFTLLATDPSAQTNLLLNFIISNKPNPDKNINTYLIQNEGVTVYLDIGQSGTRWYMVMFKALVHALCNTTTVSYPEMVRLAKAVAEPTQLKVEKLLSAIEEFFAMSTVNTVSPNPDNLEWDFLYGTNSETWNWFVDEQFNPLSKNTLPKEKEHDVSDQNLVEKISESVENKALPGAMWFVMLMDGREVQRPLTFLLTTRENDSNGIYHSITWTKSLDFVIDISKINALKFMENFSNFISILMEAKPEFFNDSSFTKIIKSFPNEWGFADDFIIALNTFFDERAMEPDYNPDEPIRWSYTCGNNDPGDFGIYNDLLFSRIVNGRAQNQRELRFAETKHDYIGLKQMKSAHLEATIRAGGQLVDQINSVNYPLGGYNPHDVLKEQIGIREYACCALGAFKNAKVYFVDSLKGLCQLEADLKRTDLVKTERRDMEQWFDYPEPRGKIIRLNNFDSVMVLHYGECGYLSGWRNTAHSVIAHEALHVVLSLCKHINYNPLNEQEPAAYAMEFITLEALGYYLPRMERISE